MASDVPTDLLDKQPTRRRLPIERILDDFPYFGATSGGLPKGPVEQVFRSNSMSRTRRRAVNLTVHPHHRVARAWRDWKN
jgi:hypothetical protein